MAPAASCAGSVVTIAQEMARTQDRGYSADTIFVATMIVVVVSFVLVLLALLFVALPATLLMDRVGVPSLMRDALLLAAAVGAAIWALTDMGAFPNPRELGLVYGLATGLLWILAVRWIAGRARRRASSPAAFE